MTRKSALLINLQKCDVSIHPDFADYSYFSSLTYASFGCNEIIQTGKLI